MSQDRARAIGIGNMQNFEDRTCGSGDIYPCGQTDTHTHTHTHDSVRLQNIASLLVP